MPQYRYKKLLLLRPQMPPATLGRILAAFNEHFAKEEIHLTQHHDGVLINLRELAMHDLHTVVKKLRGTSDTTADFLANVESAVMNVKSYGLRERRRDYRDDQAERKVKNRADKKQRRGTIGGLAKDRKFMLRQPFAPALLRQNYLCR